MDSELYKLQDDKRMLVFQDEEGDVLISDEVAWHYILSLPDVSEILSLVNDDTNEVRTFIIMCFDFNEEQENAPTIVTLRKIADNKLFYTGDYSKCLH